MGDRQNEHRRLSARDPDRRESREVAPDAEEQLDTEQREERPGDRRANGVGAPPEPRGHDRHHGEDGHGAREVEREPARVGQEGAEDDLEVHHDAGGKRQSAERRIHVVRRVLRCAGGEERDR